MYEYSYQHAAHTDEHSVFVGVSSVLDDGDDVGSLLGHVEQVAPAAVRELHCIHQAVLHNAMQLRERLSMIMNDDTREGAESLMPRIQTIQ